MRLSLPRHVAPLAVFALLACQIEDWVAVAGPGGGADAGSSAGAGPDASAGKSVDCGARAPLVSVVRSDGASTEACSGLLAARTFTHALCSCGDVAIPGDLFSTAFDSAGSESRRGGASVGVNGNYTRAGGIGVEGSVKVASSAPIETSSSLRIGGDVWLAGPATVGGVFAVARDAWLTGSVSALGVAAVARDLHLGPGATLTSIGLVEVGGTTTEAPFTLEKPCACDAEELLDIDGLVAAARTANDNALIALAPEAFDAASDSPPELVLPCGRFYSKALRPSGALRLEVTGRVALFVEGDVVVTKDFSLAVGPGAELDWFILGNLTLDPEARLGDAQRPAAVRVYVQGQREIRLPGGSGAAFNLYAPAAPVAVDGTGDVYGSVFAGGIAAVRDVLLHYDRAVIRAGETCVDPAGSCQPCAQCNAGPDCLTGACFTCASDSDCCAPFVCQSGSCQPLLAGL